MLELGISFAMITAMKQIKFYPQYIIYNKFTGVGQNIDPNLIILTVLTALGRDLIVLNIAEMDVLKIIAMDLFLQLP
jgi:hypothetical protein